MQARVMTAEEHAQGWYVCCTCGKHAYLFKAALLRNEKGHRLVTELCTSTSDLGLLALVEDGKLVYSQP